MTARDDRRDRREPAMNLYRARRVDAWAVRPAKKDGERDWWTKIGTAFKNADGSFTILLDALPLAHEAGQAKIIIREALEREERDR